MNSATSIIAVAPAHASGVVDIAVTTAGGTATLTSTFTYVAAPTLTSISPSAGPLAGGTSVTITGTHLTGATSVTFGGSAATSFTVDSATSITAVVPAHASGDVDVVVSTAGGTATATDSYTYVAAPTLTSLSPSVGLAVGGTSATITGTDLTGATSVTFGGTAVISFTANSATSITVIVPTHAAGLVDVVVTTPGGSTTLSNGYQYM